MRSVLSILLALAGAPAWAITAGDFLFRTTGGDGGSGYVLPYRIYVPAACADRRCPLIVFLHGAGETGSNNTSQLNNRANGAFQLPEAAEAAGRPVIMAAPQTPEWWGNEGPTGGVADMIDDIAREFGFDPARVYVTGLSMGGGGTLGFVQRYDGVAAAAVPVCPAGSITSTIDRDRLWPIPFWFFHAINDGTVGVDNSRNSVATLRAGGGDPLYTEYAGGNHGIWTQSYGIDQLTPWLLAQRWRTPMTATDPFVSLSQPTSAATFYTDAAELSVAGTTGSDDAAVSAVGYVFGPLNGNATGTSPFTAGPLAVPGDAATVLRLQATGTSYVASWGGNTTFSRSVRVVRPSAANRAPRVALWVEPVATVGRPLRLRALADDDAQPLPVPAVNLAQIEGPAGAALAIDEINPAQAWWTPTQPGFYRLRAQASDGAHTAAAIAGVLVLAADAPRPTVVAVNAGGPAFAGVDGVSFAADAGFSGGSAEALTSGLTTLAGTEDDTLHRSMRRGASFGYDMPVANGRYLVVAYFSEWRWFSQVARGIDLRLEGEEVLAGFDLYRWAGLRNAMRMGFVAEVDDGVLDLDVLRSAGAAGDARLDAFEVLALPALDDLIMRNGFEPL